MLDVKKLAAIPLLCKSGWNEKHNVDIQKCYTDYDFPYGAQEFFEDMFFRGQEILLKALMEFVLKIK